MCRRQARVACGKAAGHVLAIGSSQREERIAHRGGETVVVVGKVLVVHLDSEICTPNGKTGSQVLYLLEGESVVGGGRCEQRM